MEKGQITVNTENIFPIIKQFLYSEQEIFLRELISNAVDATSKLKTLSSKGVAKGELGDLTIEIIPNKEARTLTIKDKGIGLTSEETKKYLNQVAFSSAQEFLEKYKDDANIIGHFGLGFYSAFMVADKVEVNTLSYQEDAEPVIWSCTGDTNFEINASEKTDRGTEIILHLSDDAMQYAEDDKLQELLNKYCKFLPVPIKLGMKKKTISEGEGEEKTDREIEVANIINNTNPLWKKSPSELSEQDYINFYKELYPYSSDPLFWIHLNIDYPFNLTGVLYFPKIETNFDIQKNKIHLYSNQVFVTDDVKEIVPEFLMLLHGVIDSPDIPLNVSRSYLQADSHVRKISGYITKKVAEKLNDLFKQDRAGFEAKWPDIGTFIKYGYLSDDKFEEKVSGSILLKNTDGQYFTIDEYKEKIKDNQTDKDGKITVLYSNVLNDHHSYIQAAKTKGYDVLEMDQVIDNHFIQHLEYKKGDFVFKRIDSDVTDHLISSDETIPELLTESEIKSIEELYKNVLKDSMNKIEVKPLSSDVQPVQIVKPEFMRRMTEMQMLQGHSMGKMPEMYTIVINSNHPLIANKLLKMEDNAAQENMAKNLYDLARLSQQMLTGADLTNFINNNLVQMSETSI
ncbi:MAG: molecular chaperone HtpG [Saprospiraceae bacterium]|uniref:molecular chaperone HtpG n=1 Tax=Candidatus Brachybacter algidus TaxID=2982024 RepID=UPI001B73770E|nr:molecular chaperone HtpG [Candidatus Brachybacter algidus]MBP7306364.1 molecular chaperone HtpG [Saprospiraceae bacterium]MBK6448961.1 molecular chaperone HtpG [Candidatus Brachybacter algidus]MBK9025999.1 molecular chaperone HtpG [Candidatus Brachybacter algidus]MBK9553451.1 molecular chaperone HtpG [Candidatus Brachybacter algidus]MBP7539908.1 molecular chaperone HtpG [Saprospiraceae bacterium]